MVVFNALSPLETLQLTIIGEARGEPIEGQVAVGCVIRNRLHAHPDKYNTYKDVCLAKEQFSCWNLNDRNYPFLTELAIKLVNGQLISDPYIRQCIWVGEGIFNWAILDNTKGSEYYLTTKLFESKKRPEWAVSPKSVRTIGEQVFFNV